MISRKEMKCYATALDMWQRRFNTAEIAAECGVPEYLVCRWLWSFREIMRASA